MTAANASWLRAGIALHEAGHAAEAEVIYAEVAHRDSKNGDAWHLLARAALDRGDPKAAAANVLQAIRLNPETAAFHNSLGEILAAQGEAREAAICYREALRLQPDFVPALVNLGNALQTIGQPLEASIVYGKAIQSQPDCAEAFTNLGNALRAEGCPEDALDCYREAFRLSPRNPEVLVNLAAGLLHQKQYAEAEVFARRALEVKPGLAEAHSNLAVSLLNQDRLEEAEDAARQALTIAPLAAHLHVNLASVLLERKRLEEAEAACRRALELEKRHAEAANNLGIILQAQDRFDEAASYLEHAVEWQPQYWEAWTNLGTVREMQGRHTDALACFDAAIERNPAYPKAHFCRAVALLRAGRLAEGFAGYEWRWKARGESVPEQAYPAWDGAPADGKTIFLFGEQGLGDTIQFARFAPLVAARAGRVVMECQPPLVRLLRSVQGVAEIVPSGSPLPKFDAQASLMSLPHLLGTIGETIPAGIPYIHAKRSSVAVMRKALGVASGLRVGLAWAGNPKHAGNRHRSIPLDALAPLSELNGVEWFSLHTERAEGGWLREPLTESTGMVELAALMSCLDLIVTVDSMPAHLAGAMGRPVWVMLSWTADWRWQTVREDSPWYPTMRLFRQHVPNQWEPVVHRVATALQQEFDSRTLA